MSPAPLRVAVLFSGRGSNLRALIEARDRGELDIEIVGAFSDRADAEGLAIAQAAGLSTGVFLLRDFADKPAYEAALFAAVAASAAEIIVLAGYMRIVGSTAVTRWAGRMINIHPSLLPLYPGLHTHARVLANADTEHGASVHFVSGVLDGGPVLMQARIKVLAGDSAESLAARLLRQEHRLLVASVALIAARRVRVVATQIWLDDAPLALPLLVPAQKSAS